MLSINLLQYTRICLTGARYERACYTVQEHVTHELVMHEHVICTVQERDKLDFFILNIFFVLK